VVAASATEADVFALILGAERGSMFLERQGAAGFFLISAGSTVKTQGLAGRKRLRKSRQGPVAKL
jgi:thiamine biosynthesis lipoprotein ApbE